MLKPFCVLAASLFLVSSIPADTGAKKAPPSTSKWTPDVITSAETARDFQLSPDGKQVLWVRGQVDDDAGEMLHHIMRSIPGPKKDVQLTRGTDSCTAPRWSPD